MILAVGAGVYRLLIRLARPAWVNWALLPGTVVSETAYIFGCLITGGEIRRAKIMPGGGDRRKGGDAGGEPATEAAARWKTVGPVIASLISIVGCAAAILLVHSLLGERVINSFATRAAAGDGLIPTALPQSWAGFWDQLKLQVDLLRRMAETWGELLAGRRWDGWRVVLFVYLALCLSLRLAPAGKPIRATLAAVGVLAAIIAVAGAISTYYAGFSDLIERIWPLVTYVWTSLLLVLAVTLLIAGVTSLARAVLAKGAR